MLERLIDLSLEQLTAQIQSFGSLDAKAGAVLGADAVFAGLLLHHGSLIQNAGLAVSLCALILSVMAGVIAMWAGRPLLGPLASIFYRQYAASSPVTAQAQLLADVADAVLANEGQLARKGAWWAISATALTVSVILALVAQA